MRKRTWLYVGSIALVCIGVMLAARWPRYERISVAYFDEGEWETGKSKLCIRGTGNDHSSGVHLSCDTLTVDVEVVKLNLAIAAGDEAGKTGNQALLDTALSDLRKSQAVMQRFKDRLHDAQRYDVGYSFWNLKKSDYLLCVREDIHRLTCSDTGSAIPKAKA